MAHAAANSSNETSVLSVCRGSGPGPRIASNPGCVAIRQQGLAVRGAIKRHMLAGAAGNQNHLVGRGFMIDEQHLPAIADGQMRSLARTRRELPHTLMAQRDEQIVPAVFSRQTPDGRAEHVLLAPNRIGKKSAPAKSVGETETLLRSMASSSASCPIGTGSAELATASRMAKPRSRLCMDGVSRAVWFGYNAAASAAMSRSYQSALTCPRGLDTIPAS